MSKTQIERIGINAVRDYIDGSLSLRSYIDTNDKTPLWDGDIFVYDGQPDINENFIGKVETQIKTTEVGAFDKKVHFYITPKQTNTYMQNGIVYFVVQVYKIKNHWNSKIFYNCLTPMALKGLVRKQGERKKIRIDLSPIPKNTDLFTRELKEFLDNCAKQKSYINKPTLTVHKAIEKDKQTVLSTYYIGKKNNFHEELTSRPLWIYKQTEYADIPIGDEPIFLETESLVKRPVAIKDKVYYDRYLQKSNYDYNIFYIGGSITATIPTLKNAEDKIDKVELNVTGKGAQLVYDIDFYLEVLKNLEMTIGERTIKLTDEIFQSEKFRMSIPIAAKHFERFKNCVAVAKKLHIPFDLDFTDLDPNSMEASLSICDIFSKGSPVTNANFTSKIDFPFKVLNICDAKVMFAFCDLGEGQFTIHDAFHPPFTIEFMDGDIPLPFLSWIISENPDYLVDNIDIDRVNAGYVSLVNKASTAPNLKSANGIPIREYVKRLLSRDIEHLTKFAQMDSHPEKRSLLHTLLSNLRSLTEIDATPDVT